MALAYNDKYFTPPHAGRQLRADCAFLPALWADDGDAVLVDDKATAEKYAAHVHQLSAHVLFVTAKDIKILNPSITSVAPWGWDSALAMELYLSGLDEMLIPKDERLQTMRLLSSRHFAMQMLREMTNTSNALLQGRLTGLAMATDNMQEVYNFVADHGKAVMKEPWSCSGRGVRYVDRGLSAPMVNWANNVIRRQGYIMLEPYYKKVKDFGMEFQVSHTGIDYCGLSVFETTNGFYQGNIIAEEDYKEKLLAPYVSPTLLKELRTEIVRLLMPHVCPVYEGPVGVDMMVVANEDNGECRVHPMVEINLRRTMGHVSLALSARIPHGEHRLMRISMEGSRYHFRILKQ